MVAFVAGDEPKAHGNLSVIEKLAGQRNHTVNQVSFDYVFSNLAFAGLVRRHAAVGENETRDTVRCEVVDEMLHPCKVCIARWRHSVLPSHVFAQALAAPVAVIERWVSKDEVCL